MQVQKFSIEDATFERSPDQDGDIFTADLVDRRGGGPVTIGYGRWAAGETLETTIEVDDVMILLEGRLTVSSNGGTMSAGPGEIVYMPKGEQVTIQADEMDAVTAYVTYPHWESSQTED